MAKRIIGPMQGDAAFDLKEHADLETINKLNLALNKKEGEEKPKPDPIPEVKVETKPIEKAKKAAPDPKTQIKTKLKKTGAFDLKTGCVYTMAGKEIPGSDINIVLDHAFGPEKSRHPKGSLEVAQRLRYLGVSETPNSAFSALISRTSTTPTRRTSQKWTKF